MVLSDKLQHISIFLKNARRRAKRKQRNFNLDFEYLYSIAGDKCPVFNLEFKWGVSGLGKGNTIPNSPSLDRVVPELGYVKGNVVFISHWANKIKQDATEVELYAVADWLHDKRKEVLNAFKDKHPPVSGESAAPSKEAAITGPVHGAGIGEDCDGAHHYQGELFGTDAGGCT